MVNDDVKYVREAVALQKREKDLDILVYDKEWRVRRAVALSGKDKYLDVLVHDKEYKVREQIALKTKILKYLTILEQDENPFIKKNATSRKKLIFKIIEENIQID